MHAQNIRRPVELEEVNEEAAAEENKWIKIVNKKGNFTTIDSYDRQQELKFRLIVE